MASGGLMGLAGESRHASHTSGVTQDGHVFPIDTPTCPGATTAHADHDLDIADPILVMTVSSTADRPEQWLWPGRA